MVLEEEAMEEDEVEDEDARRGVLSSPPEEEDDEEDDEPTVLPEEAPASGGGWKAIKTRCVEVRQSQPSSMVASYEAEAAKSAAADSPVTSLHAAESRTGVSATARITDGAKALSVRPPSRSSGRERPCSRRTVYGSDVPAKCPVASHACICREWLAEGSSQM